MKTKSIKYVMCMVSALCVGLLCTTTAMTAQSAPDSVQTISIKSRPLQRVGNTFESVWLIDNQTTNVPPQGVLEFDILHRFGTVNKGYEDFFGLYAPSNIRLGFGYTPVNRLMVGFGFTKDRLLWDINWKYALLREGGESSFPISLTYYGNMAIDTRPSENFTHSTDRYSYFHELMFSRKVTRDFSAQIAVSASHMNNVEAYRDSEGNLKGKMSNDHFAMSFLGRYKLSDAFSIIANVDQPITKHTTNNPFPNISAGIEIATPLHAFQLYVGNYKWIVPQYNNYFNTNDYRESQWLIGFTITRLLDTQEEDLLNMMFKRK